MRKSARTMPKADDFEAAIGVIYPVNDSVGTGNNFTKFRTPKFWHHAASFREGAKRKRPVKQLIAQPFGSDGIVRSNIGNNALQIT